MSVPSQRVRPPGHSIRPGDDSCSADAVVSAVLQIFPGAEVVMTMRPCKLCGCEIIFVKSLKGNPMVFDAIAHTAWYIDEPKGEARPFKAHTPHHATCPNAAELRKAKK